MLATFVIGLREGLEAVLVVSIVAAFLKRNGISRRPMWLGVAAAVLICVGVGVALKAFEQALPQAQQEGLEAIIGLVAVVFVVLMIAWMGKHARGLKADIEGAATEAVNRGAGWALVAMAFLAVIKEGFETAVFLLATLQASTSVWAAAVGAVLGIAVSCVVGYALYTGGIRLNLGRFFRISSVFLIFVAAGLLLTALRKAHGAGWVNIGQERTVDLSWMSPIGSVQSALITGVLGIPADPRVIEVLAWFLFLVPMLLIALWPARWRPAPARRPVLKLSIAGAAAIAAVALAVLVPAGAASLPSTATLSPASAGTAQLSDSSAPVLRATDATGATATANFTARDRTSTEHAGVTADQWVTQTAAKPMDRPAELTIEQLTALFGRVPVGISVLQNPGPYQATWSQQRTTTAWTAAGGLLDANQVDHTTLVLTGGGLTGSRTLTLDQTVWAVPEATVTTRANTVITGEAAAQESNLWRVWLPIVLAAAAILLTVSAWRDYRSLRRAAAAPVEPASSPDPADTSDAPASDPTQRSTPYAVS